MKWRGLERMPSWYARWTDPHQFAEQRAWLLHDLSGDVLEVGVGIGYNLRFYPDQVTLTALDIEPANVDYVADQMITPQPRLLAASGDALPFADHSFDHLVATLVLCSVDSQAQALAEFARVLRPGGTVRLIDHTLSGHWLIDMALNLLEQPWIWFTGGCHPNRDTPGELERLGWTFEQHQVLALNLVHTMIVRPPR